ncbi:type II toxin-antitoxin system VapC family toxin [Arthrospira platensis]|uniref:type II toxin-antitoxin system VapC family toxin n=1 Tax=Limnospira TaxID=2596745 RepID=UPI0001C384DB|nr:PIN domain-containing protein [Arthrospira platensis]AMW27215.1 twitching motility protein PilT [Arthrospira platensis YZ]KDR57464.1 twitching motility protein PilT [Arthrospira platensis str. Paraca]MBD2668621.1 PIN domain-containing protein [Arthrospira platensis FACHB-439]MBD2709301.1 PIN domain-containing protein [Arthrospira platensis FACHB-835]MDF2211287.1 PIN domain-containing protein [Arthrospira platensis NCB002]MDT9309358.1 PIN domain-containing protein [Limnospira sp. Paracas R1
MTYYPVILIDSGILVAYYSSKDRYHQQVRVFFERCTSNLVTTVGCATEVMWLLGSDWRTQNEFLHDMATKLYECIPLLPEDFSRIAELNQQYADLPGDFADLSLIVISERLNIPAIATLDSDFDVYRRYRNQAFERAFIPES